MTTTQILNEDTNEPVTHITVMRAFTYEVDAIVKQLREDNRDNGELTISIDDVLEYIDTLVDEDFVYHAGHTRDLLYTDQDGNTF